MYATTARVAPRLRPGRGYPSALRTFPGPTNKGNLPHANGRRDRVIAEAGEIPRNFGFERQHGDGRSPGHVNSHRRVVGIPGGIPGTQYSLW